MKGVLLAILIALPACAQTLHGLGSSSKTCVDLDGDGYGTGPLAGLITTSSVPVTPGAQTVTLGATTGLAVGQRVRYDTGTNLEFVALTAVSGSTITGNFLGAHASGVTLSAGTRGDSLWFPGYTTDDPGCLGPDADDRDATVQTAAQGITKYGSLAAFLAKLGRDIQIYESDTATGASQGTGVGALLQNTAHTYYLAPSSPSANCTGTTAQCTGMAYPTNNCVTINTPCLTVLNLVSAGYRATGVGGDLIIMRDGWGGALTFYSGAPIRYNGAMAYPGELPVFGSGQGITMAQSNCSGGGNGASYIFIRGVRVKNAAGITGGSAEGCSPSPFSDNHDVLIDYVNGTEGGDGGLAPISAFSFLIDWTVEYSVLHDDNCPSSCNTPHGIYLGSHAAAYAGSNLTIRRNLIFRNSYNGIHWNGLMTGAFIDQNVIYDNGVAGMDIQNGLQNSYIRSNLVFNNAKEISIDNYSGNCPGQVGYDSSSPTENCPNDQTGNLIENNTIYHTGNANLSNPGANPDAGCPAGINYCAKWGIAIANTTSPLVGNLGSNVYRNNVIASYGNNNSAAGVPVIFYEPGSGSNIMCDSTCLGWVSSSTFDHNQFWQSDGKGGTNVYWASSNYTCSSAGSITTSTSCADGDPQFAAETITSWNVESYFDFRLLPASPALHAGTTTGIPNYDAAGRAYAENGPGSNPSLGALERNLYSQGWTALTGAGLSPSVAPGNGDPGFSNCLNPGGSDASPCPPGGYPFQSLYTQEFTSWTDGIGRDKPGSPKQLLWFGGGHSNYVGNEIYAISLNLATPSIARIIGPSTFAAPGLTVVQTWDTTTAQPALADGTANTRHTPGNLAYNSDADKMGLFGGGLAGGNGTHSYDTWEFNFGSNAWERYNSGAANTDDVDCSNYGTGYSGCSFAIGRQVDPIATFIGSFQGSNIYDPLTKTYWVYWGCAGGCAVLTQYYPSLHQHVVRAISQPSLSGGATLGQNSRVFISDRRWIFVTDYFAGVLRNWIIDISGVTSQRSTSSPNPGMVPVTTDPSCNGLLQTLGPGLVYLPALGRILGFPAGTGGNTYYLMDPATWTCTTGSFTGGPPTSPVNPYIIGKMQHFDSLDATLLVNDVGANIPAVLNLNIGDPGTSGAPPVPTRGSTPPTISIASPATGSTERGSVAVSANAAASAPAAIASVQFKLDGANLGAVLTSAPYSISWNTTGAGNGTHTLTAVAVDTAGNSTTSAGVVVTVSNSTVPPPTISLISPAGGVTLSGTVTIAANALGTLPIAGVQFKIDGFNSGPAVSASRYSVAWATAGATNGPHTISAVATDTAGNIGTAPAVAVTVSNPSGPPPTQGLAGYWRFDEDSGSIAYDSSGNGHNGTVTGATWVPGYINSALSFNGTTNYVVTPDIPLSNAFSVSAWVNPAVTTQTGYARIAETEYNNGLYLGADSSGNKYKFIVNSGSGSTGSCGASFGCAQGGTITSGWHLIVGTFDGTTAILYVDNAEVASDTLRAPANTSYPLYIGRYDASSGYGWNGFLDEVRLYSRALSGGEVTALYNYTGTPPNSTLPVISITAPVANVTVSNTVAFTATATAAGNLAIGNVQFQLDGTNLGSAVTAVPYSISWNTTTTSNGTHTLTAIATDTSGNSATSASITVTVGDASGLAPVLSCDLNGDGVVNSLDVQIAINQALGTASCTNAALQENGVCNVVDVQRVINASLGGACRLGQ
jgi:hypothetical protein